VNTTNDTITRYRGLLPATRAALVAFSLLTLLAVIVLFVFSGETESYFAWTIQPPVTAAFLGAAYGAGFILEVLSIRTRVWVDTRVALVTILLFTVVTLIATLLHLDRFHFGATGVARFAAWFWFTIYVVVPPVLAALVIIQARSAGTDPPKRLPLPRWLAGLLLLQGMILLIVGVVLFAVPTTHTVLWPWELTPLTARVTGAWLLSFGAGALLAVWENDVGRLRIAALSYAVFGALELVVVLRFASELRWNEPAAWLFCIIAVLITATGIAGWILALRLRASAAGQRAERSAR
jgi:hypothetical protein